MRLARGFGCTVLWGKWGGSLEVRLAREFGCQGGNLKSLFPEGDICGHSLVLGKPS